METSSVLKRIFVIFITISIIVFLFSKTDSGRFLFNGQKTLLLRLAHGENLEDYHIKSLTINDQSLKVYDETLYTSSNEYPISANVNEDINISINFLYKNNNIKQSCIIKIASDSCDASIHLKGDKLFCSDTCERSF